MPPRWRPNARRRCRPGCSIGSRRSSPGRIPHDRDASAAASPDPRDVGGVVAVHRRRCGRLARRSSRSSQRTVDGRPRPRGQHGHRLRAAARRRHARARPADRGGRRAALPGSWPAPSWPTSPAPRSTSTPTSARWTRSRASGGTPVVFPSHGLNALADHEWVGAHDALGRRFDRFIGFELGPMFVPYGRIYSLDAYEGLLGVRQLHRREALVVVAGGRVGPARGARPCASRLPRVHRQRPGHRHGVLRVRLPAGPVGVRAGGLRRARPALGTRRASVPRAQRPAPVPRRVRVPGAGARVPTRRGAVPAASVVASGRTRRHAARRDVPTATARCSPTSRERLEALL